jgi:hypothetical protein
MDLIMSLSFARQAILFFFNAASCNEFHVRDPSALFTLCKFCLFRLKYEKVTYIKNTTRSEKTTIKPNLSRMNTWPPAGHQKHCIAGIYVCEG